MAADELVDSGHREVNASLLPVAAPLPSRWRSLSFHAKAWVLRLLRAGRDFVQPVPRHGTADDLREMAVLAESRSALWPQHESAWPLAEGKVHNLRVAARAFDGIVVPAGATLSFWKQLGRATRSRRFVPGRELREGCLVPSVGGGLCQLSNALYETALKGGLEIVERHRHSQVVPGSLAEIDRDATVFWNYLDLRVRSLRPWRLEVKLDGDTLTVRVRAEASAEAHAVPLAPTPRQASFSSAPGDCTSCGETECHHHVGEMPARPRRAWLMDEVAPEFATYRQRQWQPGDRWLDAQQGGGWRTKIAAFEARARRRLALWRGRPVPLAKLGGLQALARRLARRLGPSDTSVVVGQGMLPYLWRSGELGGRRFDVLMNALPMHEIQRRLDLACARHPESLTLRDFRADASIIAAEREALAHADHWISAHQEVLALAGARGVALDWQPGTPAKPTTLPRVVPGQDRTSKLAFVASSLARKGAFELREALQGLDVELLLPPGAWETPDFWAGFNVRREQSMQAALDTADLVVLPAWIEHQPRGLLMAMARGIPVIATAACGLPPGLPWIPIEAGDAQGLRARVVQQLEAKGLQ